MKTPCASLAAIFAAISLSACEGQPQSEPGTDESAPALSEAAPAISGAFDALSCGRGQDGQSQCLLGAFDAPACEDVVVLESMRRLQDGTRIHYTAYDAGAQCLTQLRESALERGFAPDPETAGSDELIARPRENYTEKLMIDTAEDGSGNAVWERIQE